MHKHYKTILALILCMIGLTACMAPKSQEPLDLAMETDTPLEEGTSLDTDMSHEAQDQEQNNIDEALGNQVLDGYERYIASGEYPSIAKRYEDVFSIGVAIPSSVMNNEQASQLVAEQFNSITCENEMKPDFLLDYEQTIAEGDETSPAINYRRADGILSFAADQGIGLRGHTLVWHSQTPRWLFTEGYSKEADAPLVTRELMLQRMEHYIAGVMDYANTTYPGLIYAWDVVNEAINPSDGQAQGIRTKDNLWYQTIGPDYVQWAFTYARQYADPDQSLFYNDYGTTNKQKMAKIIDLIQPIAEAGLLDGMGMQSHIQQDAPNTTDYQYAILKYAQLGIQIQITELDIDTLSNEEVDLSKLAIRYRHVLSLFETLKTQGQADISNVTIWGLTDHMSWLNNDGEASYPLLFKDDYTPKYAFFGAIQDPSVPLYYKP